METSITKLSYYEKNKDRLQEKQRNYRLEHLEQIKIYKAYWDEINQYKNKDYYMEHKNKILENMLIKIECDKCKCFVSKCNMNKHIRTSKHIRNNERQNL